MRNSDTPWRQMLSLAHKLPYAACDGVRYRYSVAGLYCHVDMEVPLAKVWDVRPDGAGRAGSTHWYM